MKKKILGFVLVICFILPLSFMVLGCSKNTYEINLYTNTQQGVVYGDGRYEEGQEILIVAEAKEGFEFYKWSDGNTNPIREIVVNQNYSLTANFKKCAKKLVSVELFLTFGNSSDIEYVGIDYLNFEIAGQEIGVFDDVNSNNMDMFMSKGLFSGSYYYNQSNKLVLFVEDNEYNLIDGDQSSVDINMLSKVISWQDCNDILTLTSHPINTTITVDLTSNTTYYTLLKDTEHGYTVNIGFNFE